MGNGFNRSRSKNCKNSQEKQKELLQLGNGCDCQTTSDDNKVRSPPCTSTVCKKSIIPSAEDLPLQISSCKGRCQGYFKTS